MTDLISSSSLYPKRSTSRMTTAYAYELDDDLLRRRVEVLERRYGGRERAHSAATLIQRTFRDWALNRRFQAMMNTQNHSSRESQLYSHKSVGALPSTGRHYLIAPPLQRIAPPLAVDSPRSRSVTASRVNTRYTPSTSLLAQLRADRGIPCTPPTTLLDDKSRMRSGTRSPPSPAPTSRQRTGGSNMIESLMSPRLVTRRLVGLSPSERPSPSHPSHSPSPLLMSPVDPLSPSSGCPSSLVWVPRVSVPYPYHGYGEMNRREGRDGIQGVPPPPPPPALIVGGGLMRGYGGERTDRSDRMDRHHTPPTHSTHSNSLSRMDKRERRERHEEVQRQVSDVERKRQYRVALNFFNKNPNRGVQLLTQWGFVDESAESLAKLMFGRRGLSKQMIGEYLGQHEPFHTYVLDLFISQIDVQGLEVDDALRKVLSFFRLPGESQKIERILETFSKHYTRSNPGKATTFTGGSDTIHVLVYAMIMLQTSLHNPAVQSSSRMTKTQFVKLLDGADNGRSMDKEMLCGIFDRIRTEEFKQGEDHVTQVQKVEADIIGKDKPRLSECHRRLVCYCRLHSIVDAGKKQSESAHERDVYLFNDMILVTKSVPKKKTKNGYQYMLKSSSTLLGAKVKLFSNSYYSYGIDIDCRPSGPQMLFAAKNHDDRIRFVSDVHEAILECTQMEAVRLEMEFGKQHPGCKSGVHSANTMVAVTVPKVEKTTVNGDDDGTRLDCQRDSGVSDVLVDELEGVHVSSPSDTSSASSASSGVSSSSLIPAETSIGSNGLGASSSSHPRSSLLTRRSSFHSLDSGMVEEQFDNAAI